MKASDNQVRLNRLRRMLEGGETLFPEDQQWIVKFAVQMHEGVSKSILAIRDCFEQPDTLDWPQRISEVNEDLADAIGDGSE